MRLQSRGWHRNTGGGFLRSASSLLEAEFPELIRSLARLATKSEAASCPISRARRYATSVIAGTGRTIGSRILSRTRIVASCSASDALSEAKRNPESRRTAITNSLSNHGACRSQHAESRPRGRRCSPARLSSDRPSTATTLPQVTFDPHLWIGIGVRPVQAGFPEAVLAPGGVHRLVNSGVLRFFSLDHGDWHFT